MFPLKSEIRQGCPSSPPQFRILPEVPDSAVIPRKKNCEKPISHYPEITTVNCFDAFPSSLNALKKKNSWAPPVLLAFFPFLALASGVAGGGRL